MLLLVDKNHEKKIGNQPQLNAVEIGPRQPQNAPESISEHLTIEKKFRGGMPPDPPNQGRLRAPTNPLTGASPTPPPVFKHLPTLLILHRYKNSGLKSGWIYNTRPKLCRKKALSWEGLNQGNTLIGHPYHAFLGSHWQIALKHITYQW